MSKNIKKVKVSVRKSSRNIVVNKVGYTVKDLQKIAKEKGVKGYSKMKKKELLKYAK